MTLDMCITTWPRFMSYEVAAAYTSLSRRTLEEFVADKAPVFAKLGAGKSARIIFDRMALDGFLSRQVSNQAEYQELVRFGQEAAARILKDLNMAPTGQRRETPATSATPMRRKAQSTGGASQPTAG